MYRFYSQLLLRTPAYPVSTYLETELQELLTEPHFRAAIFLASPFLYQELKKRSFQVPLLSPGALHALSKYRNRMCFRPTPFGLFSGFALAHWAASPGRPLIMHKDKYKIKASLSFSETLKNAAKILDAELADCHTYRTNGSLYKAGSTYRFLTCQQPGVGEVALRFSIDTVPYQAFLRDILHFCKEDRLREEVVGLIRERTQAQAPTAVCEEFFDQLVAQQLLLSTLAPNSTGPEYLPRLLDVCHLEGRDSAGTERLASLLAELEALSREGICEGSVSLLRLGDKLVGADTGKPGLYVNLDLGSVTGGVDAVHQQNILDGLQGLWALLPSRRPQGLQDFSLAFKRKFENRTVPLLLALDPEAGIGYQDLTDGHAVSKLLEGISLRCLGGEAAATPFDWSPAHAMLMEKWRTTGNAAAPLVLTEEELQQLPKRKATDLRPPSISVLFRVLDNQVVLEQAGGVSATALLGRFTPLHEEVEAMARELVQKEEAANPGVVFAEIAHLGDIHVANIEHRKALRAYEIPVLVHSTLDRQQQLPLADLWVSIQADQVVLFSKNLQQVVVPRLSSAYNFSREDLAVYRFLCDLQYQGIEADFTLDLQQFFPGMRQYPRVVYKSAILQLASWHLGTEELGALQAAVQDPERLRTAIARQGWPRHIALTEHDHQLVIDLEQEADLGLFARAIRHKKFLLVREYPFAGQETPTVTDETGNPYIHQFVASLYQEQEVYKALPLPDMSQQVGRAVKRKTLPGQEWLYLKVYCHPVRSNELLTRAFLPLINRLVRSGAVWEWFFVRYRDPGYHLRIRLAVPETETGKVLQAIRQKLSPYVEDDTVADVQVATYERELERYGPALMEAVEKVFCASSALVAAAIGKAAPAEADHAPYRTAFAGAEETAAAFGFSLEEKTTLFSQLFESFFEEFKGDKGLKEQLSRKYRELSLVPGLMPDNPGPTESRKGTRKQRQGGFHAALIALAEKARRTRSADVPQLVSDLVHMHLNRVFVDQPREQELVLYYCLWRHYRSQLARARP
ncbi:lantibiotic dehydratase [Pontibacter sp. SGAir0037]|uniref:lantibiotic dehydratase n=1 Tax=Pontibacter sp. SGAir0037 TaxID=2571030 RepID=UPI0010CCBDBA|nr:lantibiotic dehydratase [Pontibacter sp. SGAir0037]QCR22336.1 hypothetical protein C1N53_08295 [Pontibacter sp. SGAir0037]